MKHFWQPGVKSYLLAPLVNRQVLPATTDKRQSFPNALTNTYWQVGTHKDYDAQKSRKLCSFVYSGRKLWYMYSEDRDLVLFDTYCIG